MVTQILKTPLVHKPAELQSLELKKFISDEFLIYLTFAALILVFIYFRKRIKNIKTETLTAALLSLIFLILTIRSYRFIEYWVPFTVLAWALVAKDFQLDKKFVEWFKRLYEAKRNILALSSVVIVLPIFLVFYKSFSETYVALKNTAPYDRYKPGAEWLIKNTPEKSIVFNTDWDDFPELFFWNTHNYYIVGMDPTFMYEYDKNLYEKWRRVGDDKNEKPSETVKKYFNSKVIFTNKENKKFLEKAEKDLGLEKSYEDDWVTIFRIRD